jgi:DNA-binding HxlR family transcriptional regulator
MCAQGLARAFDFLGKRWNGVILGTLMGGPATFSELSRAVEGISDSVLSERLTELAVAGLVVRTVAGGRPVSVTYTLSPSGEALTPALQELTKWAAQNLPPSCPSSPHVAAEHHAAEGATSPAG